MPGCPDSLAIGLQELLAHGKLHDLATDRAARRRRQRLYQTNWVVYRQPPTPSEETIPIPEGKQAHFARHAAMAIAYPLPRFRGSGS